MSRTNSGLSASQKWPRIALGTMMLAWVLLVSFAAWLKLEGLGMGFDLGMYEQVIWNTAHGRLFATTPFNYTTNHIGSDLILLEAVLAPLYALVPMTMTLLIFQIIAVALGAVPLYLIGRDRLHSAWAGVILAAAYLCYLPLLYLSLNEFQPRAFALVCVLFAVYFLDQERFAPFLGVQFLSLLTRSDVALFVAMMGIVALLWRKPWHFVLAPILLGTVWFVAAIFFIVPYFKTTPGGFVYISTFGWLGKTPTEMLVTILTRPLFVLETVFQPQKLVFLLQVFGPTLPFSLVRPDVLILTAPTLAINLLSQYGVQSNITRQYGAMLYPIVFAGAALGIAWFADRKWLQARVRRAHFVFAAVLLLLVLSVAESFLIGNPIASAFRRGASPRAQTVRALLQSIPPDAPLALSNHVGPFAGQRIGFYYFPAHQFYTSSPLQVADYILIDLSADKGDPDIQATLPKLQDKKRWELLIERDGYLLYHKRTV